MEIEFKFWKYCPGVMCSKWYPEKSHLLVLRKAFIVSGNNVSLISSVQKVVTKKPLIFAGKDTYWLR